MTLRTHPERRAAMLDALLLRLMRCKAGENYPLDPVERELLIEVLSQKGKTK